MKLIPSFIAISLICTATIPAYSQRSFDQLTPPEKLEALTHITSDSLQDALACTMKAATVYAELSQETAQKASQLAHRKCKENWGEHTHVMLQRELMREQIATGVKTPISKFNDPLKGLTEDDLYMERSLRSIETLIADWRAQAKLQGDETYKIQREIIDANHEKLKLNRGY